MGTKSCWGGAMKNVNLVTYIFGVLRVQLPEVERLVEVPIPLGVSLVPS